MFRFTIRELLLVTVIAGVVIAWWIDRKRIQGIADQRTEERDLWTFRAESAAELMRMSGDEVEWDDASISITQIDAAGVRRSRMKLRDPSTAPPTIIVNTPAGPATASVQFDPRSPAANRALKVNR